MAKLGSEKRPAIVRVQTMERAEEILALCEERGWMVIVGLEPDKPEDISDVQQLLNPPTTTVTAQKVGRNEPCPCGSGKKYKKCCGAAQSAGAEASGKDNMVTTALLGRRDTERALADIGRLLSEK